MSILLQILWQIKPHLTTCKNYQRHKLNQLKVIGQEIYFLKPFIVHNTKVKPIKSFTKDFDLNNSKQIANSPFYFSEENKIGEGSYCNVFYGFNRKTFSECAIKIFKDKEKDYLNFFIRRIYT